MTRARDRRRERGQAMTEYTIIVGLIAVALSPALSGFCGAMTGVWKKTSDTLGGALTGEGGGGGFAGGGAGEGGGGELELHAKRPAR